MRYSLYLGVLLLLSSCTGGEQGNADTPKRHLVTIGAGSVTGVYFPTAGAVARIVSKKRGEHGIRATVESTGGSEYNVNAMSKGELDMGLVQSDVAYMAYHGIGKFKGRAVTQLRSLFSLHSEPFHIVARKDRGITTFSELKGKRVNVGNPGSGQRLTADTLFSVSPLGVNDLVAENLKASEAPDFLRDGRIDAYFYTVGVGAANIVDIAHALPVVIVPLDQSLIDALTAKYPYYVAATIAGGTYPGNEKDIATFAVKATFNTTTALEEKVVYDLVKTLFEDLDAFRKTHPALSALTPKKMLQGLSAPLHRGAEKYYREQGWIE